MATPWSAPIRAAKQLSIFPTSSVTGGPWKAVFTKALAEFNALSAKHSLGVTFVLASSAPDPSGVGGADVQFDTINGKATFTSFNQAFSDELGGNEMAGHTKQVFEVFGSKKTIAKAYIFVPATPIAEKDFVTKKPRVADDSAKLVIAVHELFHACGLDNSDHTKLTKGDVFCSPLTVETRSAPPGGQRPEDKMKPFGATAPVMPPLVLESATAQLIQSIW